MIGITSMIMPLSKLILENRSIWYCIPLFIGHEQEQWELLAKITCNCFHLCPSQGATDLPSDFMQRLSNLPDVPVVEDTFAAVICQAACAMEQV